MLKAIRAYFGEFGLLLKLPLEFWAIQAINLIYCLAYFALVTVGSLYLSQDCGFSDEMAGMILGGFMTGTAIIMILMGPVLDKIGYRKMALGALGLMSGGLVVLASTPYIYHGENYLLIGKIGAIAGLVIIMLGNGMISPVVMAGTKRYTNSTTRAPAFNFWYLTMNIGAILVFLIDYLRRPLENNATAEQLVTFHSANGNSHLIYCMAALCFICFVIAGLGIKTNEQFPEFDDEKQASKPKKQKTTAGLSFAKIFGMLMLTIPAHIPFVLVFMMYPKYWTRVIAPDVEIGGLEALNPAIIIAGLILFAPVVKKFNIYWVLTIGMLIGCGSCLILAVPPRWIMDFGIAKIEDAYMILIYAQIVVFSIGEFIWSPQLQNYIASVTPAGQEGKYMGISRIPYTTAKLITGTISGFMLARFCPEDIKDKIVTGGLAYYNGPEMMMLLMAFLCLMTPVGKYPKF